MTPDERDRLLIAEWPTEPAIRIAAVLSLLFTLAAGGLLITGWDRMTLPRLILIWVALSLAAPIGVSALTAAGKAGRENSW